MRDILTGRLEKRLAQYGAMAAAVAAGAVAPAEAAIVSTTGIDVSTSGIGSIYFNLATGNTGNSTTAQFRLFRNTWTTSSSTTLWASGLQSSGLVARQSFEVSALKLVASDFVYDSVFFRNYARLGSRIIYGSSYGPFYPGDDAYIGLTFTNGGNFYGWAQISVDSSYDIHLLGFAYENCGGPIHVADTSGGQVCDGGQVPEPHSAVLLGLGAAGLALYRRRHKAA